MGIKKADVKRKKSIKCLVYGASGIGKTHFALNSTPGKILVFDSDSGTDLFEGRKGFDFDYWVDDKGLKTSSIRELEKTINFLETKEGQSKYETFVIDPITDIWDNLQFQRGDYKDVQAAKKGKIRLNEADTESFNQKDWNDIKKIYKNIMLNIKSLPQNVILIANEKDVSENKADGTIVKTGEYTHDTEKNTNRSVDFCIRIFRDQKTKKKYAEVVKSRSEAMVEGEKFENPTFEMFSNVVNLMSGGKEIPQPKVSSENIFADGTSSTEEDSDEEAQLKDLQEKTLALCTKLTAQNNGDKTSIKTVIAEFADGKTNPNAIKDLKTLNNLFVKLQTMDKENK